MQSELKSGWTNLESVLKIMRVAIDFTWGTPLEEEKGAKQSPQGFQLVKCCKTYDFSKFIKLIMNHLKKSNSL